MDGNCAVAQVGDHTCFIMSPQQSPDIAIVCCQYEVAAERAGAWVRGLFQELQPQQVLIVANMQVCQADGMVCTVQFPGFASASIPSLLHHQTQHLAISCDPVTVTPYLQL